jgi:hypothetical protein
MRTLLTFLALLAGGSAYAGPYDKAPPAGFYGKIASWKQRFLERRETQWQKPAGELFAKPRAESLQKLTITKPVVEPPTKNLAGTSADPKVRVQAKVATADKVAPFDNSAGFGKHIRRSGSLHRIGWEKRAGKLARKIAMVFKAAKGKRQLDPVDGPRGNGRPKVFRANGRPTFRAVKPRPAPVFRRVR